MKFYNTAHCSTNGNVCNLDYWMDGETVILPMNSPDMIAYGLNNNAVCGLYMNEGAAKCYSVFFDYTATVDYGPDIVLHDWGFNNFHTIMGSLYFDADKDGIENRLDHDNDNDGAPDSLDSDPMNPFNDVLILDGNYRGTIISNH